MTAHWGMEDPAAFPGTEAEQRQKFRQVALRLRRRIELVRSIPIASMDPKAIEARLHAIGKG